MSKYSNISDDDIVGKNVPYRSGRREARQLRNSRQAAERHLTVRSERREQPDVRKIARAVLAIAMAEAERAAQAESADHDVESEESSDD